MHTFGAGLPRPPPMPVVPGDQEVPAGATSRANTPSAFGFSWRTDRRITASRAAAVRACGPY